MAIIFGYLSASISEVHDSAKEKTKRNTKRSDVVRVETTDRAHRILVNGNISIEYNSEQKKFAKQLCKRIDADLPRTYSSKNK